jgi:membrane protein
VRSDGREHLQIRELGKRLYRAYDDHRVASSAAALSYYFLFSLFPFLFFLATLTAYIPGVRESAETLLDRARAVVPPAAMSIVDGHVRGLVSTTRPHFLTLGLLVTVYSASRGVDAVRQALNLAYGVRESRSFWRTQLLAFGMTIGGALLVLVGITVLVLGGDVGLWLARHLHVAEVYVVALRWLRWPVTALAVISCAALVYTLLPDVKQQFRLLTPGSVVGTLVWFLAVLGFGAYVSHFGKYNATYGAIGGVIVLMTWFYITAFVLLMGGELNVVLRRPEQSPGGATDEPGGRRAHPRHAATAR